MANIQTKLSRLGLLMFLFLSTFSTSHCFAEGNPKACIKDQNANWGVCMGRCDPGPRIQYCVDNCNANLIIGVINCLSGQGSPECRKCLDDLKQKCHENSCPNPEACYAELRVCLSQHCNLSTGKPKSAAREKPQLTKPATKGFKGR